MSRSQIITTAEGREALPLHAYIFPPTAGAFEGTLVYKVWHRKHRALECYFDTVAGNHFKLLVWHKKDSSKAFRPRHSDINFADDVEVGSLWRIFHSRSRNDLARWDKAEQIG